MTQGWRQLDVGVLGGGIGGMSVAIALRRAGHRVTIYEKHDFAGEVGASVSCAANGTRWLHEWGVDVEKGDPVVLKKLINRDWHTGEPVSTFDLDDYEEKWGYVYNMFHRQYMHRMLKDCAMQEKGEGIPVKLLVNHAVSVWIRALLLSFPDRPSVKKSTSGQVRSHSRMAYKRNTILSLAQMGSAQLRAASLGYFPQSDPLNRAACTPMSAPSRRSSLVL
jgi:salicylate hydroxylase